MARKPHSRRSKKDLTRKQQTVVSDNLEKRIESLLAENATTATVISHLGYCVIVQETSHSELIACNWRQHIGNVCAGDQVLITEEEDETSLIEAVLPRKSVIEKQNVYRGSKPFAANIDQILVVITHQPMFQTSLLDRYLIMAQVVGIDCLIYFNKTDLLTDKKTQEHIKKIQHCYQKIPNVTWVSGNTKEAGGLDALHGQLDKRHTVISGQSGVGKSTLIGTLIPDISIQTKSISEASGLGRHSTTNSTLYRLDKSKSSGGVLIDTPGVRSFDTYHLNRQQIEAGFPDITPFLGRCQFSDCSHTHENKCAVKTAIIDNHISEIRYASFLQILMEAQSHDG